MSRPTPHTSTQERLADEPYHFGFFQALRLLAASRGGPTSIGGSVYDDEAVRVRPDASSVFPAADLRRLLDGGDDGATTVEVGFGGLYGIDAALPASFHETIATGEEHTRPLRDFLDFVGHRTYAQLWRAWARYRPEIRGVGAHGPRAVALAGGAGVDASLLPLAARLNAWARNAEGLRALLTHATGLVVRIVENVPRRVRLGERPRLGSARLGLDAVVGERVYDESGMFRIELGPLGIDDFRDLLPGCSGAARLAALVRLYASDVLDYDVDLILRSDEAPPLVLGDAASARLGRNATIGSPREPLLRRRVRYVPAT
ncbi:type VI secretion system baseplate subunit TssG [Rubrivirga sp. IMCC43871]|uniref:type VI secretion system baseplate subunit TssG n=1 Tax=Rubrivirga sp. IMCC43871 TaxID=3391575 RepID=UPI00398FFE45